MGQWSKNIFFFLGVDNWQQKCDVNNVRKPKGEKNEVR